MVDKKFENPKTTYQSIYEIMILTIVMISIIRIIARKYNII